MIIIDSDIAIDVLRKHRAALEWTNSLPQQTFVISGFTAIELFAGCNDKREQRAVDTMMQRFQILWPWPEECDLALRDFRAARLAGGIGALDALIAHTAIAWRLPLHTFNVKHFRHVPGLQTIQPYVR